ncbi:MAG: hypothetical protein P1U56_01565 [Saprospiraceae bacterium]|nr:hypothetical protein [Saprospiraceae bacterium]
MTYLLFGFMVIITSSTYAQSNTTESSKSLNNSQIKDLQELAKYNKTVKKLKPKKKQEKENSSNSKKISNSDEETKEDNTTSASNLIFSGGSILAPFMYIIIIGLVIFIVYLIFSNVKVNKKVTQAKNEVKNEIEDIEVIDAESGLTEALKLGNYREAVRMLFIQLLQVLIEEKKIIWKPEKTNRDYLDEMKNDSKIQHFNNLVIAYERIWYGRDAIDQLFFDYLRADFEKFYSTKNIEVDVKE